MKYKCFYVDIDGTLANVEHRQHHVLTKPKNWKAFFADMKYDLPNGELVWLIKQLYAMGNKIVICTARGEEYMEETVNWLAKWNIPYDGLYMRKLGDQRADDIVKIELLDIMKKEGFEPTMAFEDRARVVKALREKGILVFHVAEGNF